eukprot:symbB.v1.2.013496.t1/scaffold959.1/size148843/5
MSKVLTGIANFVKGTLQRSKLSKVGRWQSFTRASSDAGTLRRGCRMRPCPSTMELTQHTCTFGLLDTFKAPRERLFVGISVRTVAIAATGCRRCRTAL